MNQQNDRPGTPPDVKTGLLGFWGFGILGFWYCSYWGSSGDHGVWHLGDCMVFYLH